MTWLLHQFQKVLGALTGSRRRADVSAPTQFGSKAAARLQQGRIPDPDAPVAKRVSSSQSLEPIVEASPPAPSVPQSTATLRQKSYSALKDTVDPVAAEPDTHHRLDAAPAALPGGTPAIPSFPTDVSDLISSQSTIAPRLKQNDGIDDLSIADVKDPADEQLPDIHDLLPAIEPIEVEPAAIEPDEADLPLAESLLDDEASSEQSIDHAGSTEEDETIVEPAERVSADSERATLFSFDITEADTAPEVDIVPEADTFDDADAADIAVHPESIAETFKLESVSTESVNPWLTATPPPKNQLSGPLSTESTSTELTPPELLSTKQGNVKLLFTLKPGNFHGYIAPEDGSKDILFHQKYINAEIFDALERGARVVATVKTIEGKVYATHVDLLQE